MSVENVKQEIEKHINDLSLLLVMVDAADEGGREAAYFIVEQVRDAAADELPELKVAAEQVLATKAEDGATQVEVLTKFSSEVQSFLNGGLNSFSVGAPKCTEFGDNYDEDFLVDFIERHSLMLDEFEGAVVDFKQGEADRSDDELKDFTKYVKSYLHNIKGDAGAIGLKGIEIVTHRIEDMLSDKLASQMLDEFIAYKEWVSSCIECFKSESEIEITSVDFLASIFGAVEDVVKSEVSASSELEVESAEETMFGEDADDTSSESDEALETYDIPADAELLYEFAAEAEDHLNEVESVLLTQNDDLSADDVGTIFRGVHSLKGASSYFNLLEINETSHILENLFDEVRGGKRVVDPTLVGLVFRYIDLQKTLLANARAAVENGGKLTRTKEGNLLLKALDDYSRGVLESVPAVAKDEPVSVSSEPESIATPTIEAEPAEPPAQALKQKDKLGVKTFVKVDTQRLDSLIDSIGEMVIYSSILIRSCRELLEGQEDVIKTSHQVEKFSRDLQEIGMSMRLDPIKGLFQKMSRLVWDVSKKLNKDIAFEMKGEDTEMDRNMIEKLADPLMHMVRNAMDHGIEPPDEREAAGKPRQGNVELLATHAGGSIVVQIKDDGRGLDPEKLKQKAIDKGIISPDQELTEQEALNLIFAPGFSTAAAVTDISGRGVGMDVVRNNIESMRGRIITTSKVGEGSTFRIELPLTLAILDGIETTVGAERFIIPTLSIVEFMRPTREMMSKTIQNGELFYFRGKYLPLYRISDLYEIKPKFSSIYDATVVVVENVGEQVAFLVDDIVGSSQVVIKSLGEMFKEDRGKGLAGCTILADGSIGLILDVRSLIEVAKEEYTTQVKGAENSWSQGEPAHLAP